MSLTLKRAPADVEERLRQISGVQQIYAKGPAGNFLLECALGQDIREDIARVAVTGDWGLVELKSISMTLEDVFLRLIRDEEGISQTTESPS